MFYVFLIIDRDANPSTAVPHIGITKFDTENVITVEVNNKYEIGHTLVMLS